VNVGEPPPVGAPAAPPPPRRRDDWRSGTSPTSRAGFLWSNSRRKAFLPETVGPNLTPRIVNIVPGSPAAKSELAVGDALLSLNGQRLQAEEAKGLLRAAAGSVRLVVRRERGTKPRRTAVLIKGSRGHDTAVQWWATTNEIPRRADEGKMWPEWLLRFFFFSVGESWRQKPKGMEVRAIKKSKSSVFDKPKKPPPKRRQPSNMNSQVAQNAMVAAAATNSGATGPAIGTLQT